MRQTTYTVTIKTRADLPAHGALDRDITQSIEIALWPWLDREEHAGVHVERLLSDACNVAKVGNDEV